MRYRPCVVAFSGLAVGLSSSARAQQIFSNGPVSTGVVSGSGIVAPPVSTWSELAEDCGAPSVCNSAAGYQCAVSNQTRLTDDFSVPAGQWWTVSSVIVYGYQTGSTTTSTLTGATLRIWNGRPGDATSTVVFGDALTNRLQSTVFGSMFRTFNTTTPATCGGASTSPDQERPVMANTIAVGITLSPGTYWVDFDMTGSLGSGPWSPLTTLAPCGRQADPNANASQFFQGAWIPVVDPGAGCNPTPVPQAVPFRLNGSIGNSPPCYANCDSSTLAPVLNVNDFICFQTRFAAGDAYANCDSSTIAPVLNVNDFICFQTKFAAGCP